MPKKISTNFLANYLKFDSLSPPLIADFVR